MSPQDLELSFGSSPGGIQFEIDVEGAELLALCGAQELLARRLPSLVIAIHPEPMRLMGTSPQELVAFLNAPVVMRVATLTVDGPRVGASKNETHDR
jgi:hypothetical protein